MAQIKRFKAKKQFKLDCGHVVKAGEEFVVSKVFTCPQDSTKLAFYPYSREKSEKG